MQGLVLIWVAPLIVVAMATFAFAQGRLAQPQIGACGTSGAAETSQCRVPDTTR